jgi:hypothetical protein
VTQVSAEGDNAVVAFEKKHVKHAPTTKTEGVLSPDENDALYSYYGMAPDPRVHAGSRDASLYSAN